MKIVLPYPPSLNRMYRTWKGRMLLSREGREYYDVSIPSARMQMVAAKQARYDGKVGVIIHAYLPDNRRRDIDNILKPIFDTLTKGEVIKDDHLIWDLKIQKHPPANAKPEVVILIKELEDEHAKDSDS